MANYHCVLVLLTKLCEFSISSCPEMHWSLHTFSQTLVICFLLICLFGPSWSQISSSHTQNPVLCIRYINRLWAIYNATKQINWFKALICQMFTVIFLSKVRVEELPRWPSIKMCCIWNILRYMLSWICISVLKGRNGGKNDTEQRKQYFSWMKFNSHTSQMWYGHHHLNNHDD